MITHRNADASLAWPPDAPRPSSLCDFSIYLRDERPGDHRAPCPECAKTKSRPRDGALSVTIKPHGGAVWTCWRCRWSGGFGPDRGPSPQHGPGRVEPGPEPSPTRLTPAGVRLWRGSAPIERGALAAVYLASRGCPVPPAGLRWLPAHTHPEGFTGPALVALVTDVLTGEPIN